MTIREFMRTGEIIRISKLWAYDNYNCMGFERYIAKNKDKYILFSIEGVENQSTGLILTHNFQTDLSYLNKILRNYPTIISYDKFNISEDVFDLEEFLNHIYMEFDDEHIDDKIADKFILDNMFALMQTNYVTNTDCDYMKKFFNI